MWSTCRALEIISVRGLLGILSEVAGDRRTWPDIRNRCIIAIGNIESPAAARALSNILGAERDAIVRESVIEALVNLGTSKNVRNLLEKSVKKDGEAPFSITDSLMSALLDDNAQIRHRAAEALFSVVIDVDNDEKDGEKVKKAHTQARISASEMIVKELLKEQVSYKNGIPRLVDALRVVDSPDAEIASMVLSPYLFSDDEFVKLRAEHALKLLGGEKYLQDLIRQRSKMLRNPVLGVPNKKYTYAIFMLMPFALELKPIYDNHIKKIAQKLNLSIARADDFFSNNSIMEEIWSAIAHARVLVADCTNKNPNVFYEIGLAHAISKPVILITQNPDDVPFDLRHRRYIHYSYTPPGMEKFENDLALTILETLKDLDTIT
jgi:hypothetical protein